MPKVSIGLPVYNGQDFVGAAVESLLAQTFTDFELLICDNASTDRTEEICRAFAARDKRVRYHRNARNVGGGPNLGLAFELSTPAPYFKWAAHDDIHAPTFLERCVEALDTDPTAVLAFCKVKLIDADGQELRPRAFNLPLGSPDALTRFNAILPSYDCLEIYGVMRREALARRPVIGLHPDGDGVLLARMALIGRFHEVPEVLFSNRRHAVQAGSRFEKNHREWAVWWNPENRDHRVYPAWRRLAELWRSMLTVPIPARDRLRCGLALARWTNWRRGHLYEDVAFYARDLLRPGARQ